MEEESFRAREAAAREVSASFSRLLRTLSSASMTRRHCPLAHLQPLRGRQRERGDNTSSERCDSSFSDDSNGNNNGRREGESENEAGEKEEEPKEQPVEEQTGTETQEEQEELKREGTVNVNVVRANFKCNDMECSLVLGDYVNGKCR